MIRRPNVLAKKVERLDGVTVGQLIARTDQMIEKAAVDYETWVQEDLRKLKDVVGRLMDGGEPQAPNIAAAFRIAADIRDQGGVCGYPLVTVVAGLLCKFIDETDELDERDLALVEAHVDSLHTILAQRIRAGGQALAKHLVSSLESAGSQLRDEDQQDDFKGPGPD